MFDPDETGDSYTRGESQPQVPLIGADLRVEESRCVNKNLFQRVFLSVIRPFSYRKVSRFLLLRLADSYQVLQRCSNVCGSCHRYYLSPAEGVS